MDVPDTPDKEYLQVLQDILISIILQEAGLWHIINAEGEKIQAISYGIATNIYNEEEVISIEISVNKVIQLVTKLEMLLEDKMELVVNLMAEIEKVKSQQ